jgi:hypothetical protein
MFASVYTLVLMALDRYLAIVHPIASIKWRTTNRTGIALVITWVGPSVGYGPIRSSINISEGFNLEVFEIVTL